MSNNWKEVPFEILPDDGLCLIMPCEVDPEQEPFVFWPKVKIVDNFTFASDEMRNLFGQGTTPKE